MDRLRSLSQHLAPVLASASLPAPMGPVESALNRVPGGDGPGDPGVPKALDPLAAMSVFILVGQSSMAGRGMLPEFQTLIPDIEAFHYLHDTWDVAREPLHIDPPIRDSGIKGKSSYPMGTGLGLGYSFARELLASGGVDGPIGLVPCAYGGSPLSRWEKQPGLIDRWENNALNIVGNGGDDTDGDLYARMLRRTRQALERPNTILRGVLFHQGESDTRDIALAESYGERLTQLIANIRHDFAAPELPFLIGELGHWLRSEPTPDGKGTMQ
eukprot:COSAG01_NODE_6815_length_3485_cov_1.305875_1_plen_271_part_00